MESDVVNGMRRIWDATYQQWYIVRLDAVTSQWVFHEWIPQDSNTTGSSIIPSSSQPIGLGSTIRGSYDYRTPGATHYEPLDTSFHVRHSSFFKEGQVFAVLFTEATGTTGTNEATSYNSALSRVKYQEFVHTQVRRFIVVRHKREFCYAVPIFTYSGQGTRKRGVVPSRHAIAYSHGFQPRLLDGEAELSKAPVCIVMDKGEGPLMLSSRIYFGINHPIQHNVKVKSIGYVHPDSLASFLGYWNEENDYINNEANMQESPTPKNEPEIPEALSNSQEIDFKPVPSASARAFFKKGRVFVTRWQKPQGQLTDAMFAVVKSKHSFSICLRMELHDELSTAQCSESQEAYANVVVANQTREPEGISDNSAIPSFYVKVEHASITVAPGTQINFARPYTVNHDVQVRNVGRVIGDSIGLMEDRFAKELGLVKPATTGNDAAIVPHKVKPMA